MPVWITGCGLVLLGLFLMAVNAIDGFKKLKIANVCFLHWNENVGRRYRQEALWHGVCAVIAWSFAVIAFYSAVLPDLWPGYWTISILPK